MANELNNDERLAEEWLRRQKHIQIQRLCNDPPDFMVDGRYAVEVRRLNLTNEVDGKTKGEENSRIPLCRTIKSTLAKIGPPANDQSLVVDCEYDFSKPLPEAKDTKKQIREALLTFTQPYDDEVISELRSKYIDYHKHAHELDSLCGLHLCLPCGICLELQDISAQPARFVLQNVSAREGLLVLPELQKNIKAEIKEKYQKIKDRENNCDTWWLILIDHIGRVPISGLTQTELKELRKEIRTEAPWSRVIIVSLWDPDSWYEL